MSVFKLRPSTPLPSHPSLTDDENTTTNSITTTSSPNDDADELDIDTDLSSSTLEQIIHLQSLIQSRDWPTVYHYVNSNPSSLIPDHPPFTLRTDIDSDLDEENIENNSNNYIPLFIKTIIQNPPITLLSRMLSLSLKNNQTNLLSQPDYPSNNLPLHHCFDNFKLIKLLIKKHPSALLHRNVRGETPIDIQRLYFGRKMILKYMVKEGCKVEAGVVNERRRRVVKILVDFKSAFPETLTAVDDYDGSAVNEENKEIETMTMTTLPEIPKNSLLRITEVFPLLIEFCGTHWTELYEKKKDDIRALNKLKNVGNIDDDEQDGETDSDDEGVLRYFDSDDSDTDDDSAYSSYSHDYDNDNDHEHDDNDDIYFTGPHSYSDGEDEDEVFSTDDWNDMLSTTSTTSHEPTINELTVLLNEVKERVVNGESHVDGDGEGGENREDEKVRELKELVEVCRGVVKAFDDREREDGEQQQEKKRRR